MKTVNIYKAQSIHRDRDEIESVTIIITDVLPHGDYTNDWVQLSNKRFDADAEAIVAALHSLPGGTLDRVLVKLLAEKVSQHIVPWEKRASEA